MGNLWYKGKSNTLSNPSFLLRNEPWHKRAGHCDISAFGDVEDSAYVYQQTTMNNAWRREQTMSKAISSSFVFEKLDDELYNINFKQGWKLLIRSGIPNAKFRQIMLELFNIEGSKQAYDDALNNTYDGSPPQDYFQPHPCFQDSCSLLEWTSKIFISNLTPIARLTSWIAALHPEIQYSPSLPSLIALLLVYMNEDETYLLLCKMISHSANHNRDDNWQWHLTFRKSDFVQIIATFNDLLKRDLRQLTYHFGRIKFSIDEFWHKLFGSFLTGYLNTSFLTRILQVYLSEGIKILFKVGLVVLKDFDSELRGWNDPKNILRIISQRWQELTDTEKFMNMVYKTKLSDTSSIVMMYQGNRRGFQVFHCPKIDFNSEVLKNDDFISLWLNVQRHLRSYSPHLVYSSEKHGTTMGALLRNASNIDDQMAFIIAIKTTENEVFGWLLDWDIKIDKNYKGGQDCQVFSLRPEPIFYEATGNNDMFVNISQEMILIGGGGGGAAISLDSDLLNGASMEWDTFGSAPLVADKHFRAKVLEVYALY